MDFAFTEEQETVRALADEILAKEAPWERVREVSRSDVWLDAQLWEKLAEAHLLGIAVPEAHGGMGMGLLELCVLLEEAGRRLAPVPLLETLVLGALPVAEFGSEEPRARLLPGVARGGCVLTAALEDAGAGEGETPATRASRRGDGFVLSGRKRAVPFARAAARVLVPAALDGGTAIFLVDPRGRGVSLEARVTSTGQPLFELALSDAPVGAGDLLGGPSADGAATVAWIRERALVGIAALQTGVCSEALRITVGYVREREQFGVPIGSFQAVQHRCADAFIDVEALRWCTWRAAFRLAGGLPAAREARVAKFWAAEAGARVGAASVHLHGGIGSDVDYPIHRYFLWSRALEASLGGAAPQLALLGRDMAHSGPPREAA
jgi:alkylation response protein AidB-like acyl-CoA dehydrogenase